MRTRATGHSPGGFHVLASPKRVRRQPPQPVRAPPVSRTTPETCKEQPSPACDEISTTLVKINSNVNGKVPHHQPKYQPDVATRGFNVSENQSHKIQPKKSSSRSSFSNGSVQDNQIQTAKINAIKTRGALTKKTRSSRVTSKKVSNETDFAVKDIVTVEVDSCEPKRSILNGRAQSYQTVLGKRNRSFTPNTLVATGNVNEAPNQKRARINVKDPNRLGYISVQSPSTKYTLPPFDESTKENRLSNSKSMPYDSCKVESDPGILSKSMILYRTCSPNLASEYLSGDLHAEQKNDVEAQLKQGMQSIMSRMNKYQYQPLPKNPYDSVIADTSAPHVKKSLGIRVPRASPKSSLHSVKETNQSWSESSLNNSSQVLDKTTIEDTFWDRNRSKRQQDLLHKRPKTGYSDKLKDRRMEVEKLFRTTAPNASYQNILRAVAEWAVHNSSTLPTKDEIFTYVESSKAPDATELFSTADRLFSRGTPSISSKVSGIRNVSSGTSRTKVTRDKSDTDYTQEYSLTPQNLSAENDFATRHVTFHESIETQPARSDIPSVPEEYSAPNPSAEMSPTIKTPLSKSFTSQSWAIVNTFKNLVSTPFKVLGIGFGHNTQEEVKNVTKDVSFAYKEPATPTPAKRSVKNDKRVIKNRNGYRTPVRVTEKEILSDSQTDRKFTMTPNNTTFKQRVVTEKRMAELQHELDLKKFQARERESNDDKNRRRKVPKRHNEGVASNLIKEPTESQYSQSKRQATGEKRLFEEWPPNLDPNRPVVDLAQATQNLPSGPNGEDVTTMLCSGWLISKHRDSFIRETGNHKLAPASTRKSMLGSSEFRSNQNQELGTSNLSKNLDTKILDTEDNLTQNDNNQPGRSYGFQYDDDSSSDDETTVDFGTSNRLGSRNHNDIIVGIKTPQTKFSFETNNFFNDSGNQSKHSPVADTTVGRLPPTPRAPHTPRMPSTLRNVEALSPNSSQLTTPLTEQNIKASSIRMSEDQSMVLFESNNLSSEYSRNSDKWSFMLDLDPKMMNLDPKLIAAVESLSKDTLPSVELPSIVEEPMCD